MKHIELAIEYIENNIREKLTVSTCAKSCSYSEYHFVRIFRLVTGYTPMDYVRKRRLTEAAKELLDGRNPIIEIALSWGFDSLENFIRAFQTEHGSTPGAYRQQRNSLHLFNPQKGRYNHKNANMELEPQILTMDSFIICGYTFSTNMADIHYDIPRFWNHYHVKRLGDSFNYIYHPKDRIDIGLLKRCCIHFCMRIPSYEQEGILWDKMTKLIEPQNVEYLTPCYPVTIFYDEGYKENDVDVEIQISVKGKYADVEDVRFITTDPVYIASVVIKGSFDQLTEANEAVAKWITDNGYTINGPMFNIYHVSTGMEPNPENWVTEICYPIDKQ